MTEVQDSIVRLIENGDVIAVTKNGETRFKTIQNMTPEDQVYMSTEKELEKELGQKIDQRNPWLAGIRESKRRGKM
jgi:hypothetical protein